MISGIVSGIISSILVSIFFRILTEYQRELEETGKMIEPLYSFQDLREFAHVPSSMSVQEFLDSPLAKSVRQEAYQLVDELKRSFYHLEEWKFHYEIRKLNKRIGYKICDIDVFDKIYYYEIEMLCDEFKTFIDDFEKYNSREFGKYFILRVIRNKYIWILIVNIILLAVFVDIIL